MPQPRLDGSGRDASDNWQPSIHYLSDTSRIHVNSATSLRRSCWPWNHSDRRLAIPYREGAPTTAPAATASTHTEYADLFGIVGCRHIRVGNHMIAGWRPSHGGGGDRCRDVVAAVVGRDGFVPARQQRIGQR